MSVIKLIFLKVLKIHVVNHCWIHVNPNVIKPVLRGHLWDKGKVSL